jgi:IclR family pca regulon transcriptional regulator
MPAGDVETLRRGLALLNAFDPADPELPLAELARRTGLPAPTALRLLRTLVNAGFVAHDPRSRLYHLSIGAARLSYMALEGFSPRDVAFPFLLDLHRRTGETVSMGVLVRTEVILVERLPSPDLDRLAYQIGSTLPAYCTALGKILLADLPRDELAQLFQGYELRERGPSAVTELPDLLGDLEEAAREGLAFADEEMAAGRRSVAAAVHNRSGRVVAAIAISGATSRMARRDMTSRLAALCKHTADDISLALGAQRDRDLWSRRQVRQGQS